ncbi:MAG TPA: hypothetical protein PK264_15155 [Hyphomicrobiaceae bacterium]|nr:hypothetical protein [Hyphomicrobiaceae bacterium]
MNAGLEKHRQRILVPIRVVGEALGLVIGEHDTFQVGGRHVAHGDIDRRSELVAWQSGRLEEHRTQLIVARRRLERPRRHEADELRLTGPGAMLGEYPRDVGQDAHTEALLGETRRF